MITLQRDDIEFWLSGSDVPTPGKTPSPTKDVSPTRVDTPPGPPTPEKHVTIHPATDEEEIHDEVNIEIFKIVKLICRVINSFSSSHPTVQDQTFTNRSIEHTVVLFHRKERRRRRKKKRRKDVKRKVNMKLQRELQHHPKNNYHLPKPRRLLRTNFQYVIFTVL